MWAADLTTRRDWKKTTHTSQLPQRQALWDTGSEVERGLLTLLSACCPQQLLDPRHEQTLRDSKDPQNQQSQAAWLQPARLAFPFSGPGSDSGIRMESRQ